MAGTFAGFESYILNGVRLTEEEFGRGSYAVVLRVEYRGLKCAGKQLHPVLYEQGVGNIVRRFEEECRLLAQMRHPNIVQFIGVYFEEGSRVPILVMEFLPTTLSRCIDIYGVLPEEVSYAILHDVALGLYHLHSQTPPIVHRDLSANNVLLASNMTAKISDLGVAKILNLTPQQMSRMTHTPGTAAYMPPEAMRANPRYDTTIDEFSYGVLTIHVLCGRWPLPVREAAHPDPMNPTQLIPVSEAERRDGYLRDIGNAHPLMDLILRCVSNDPVRRFRAAEIVQRMDDMVRQFPPSFANRVEMLQQIQSDINEKQALTIESQRLVAEVEQHQAEVEQLVQDHQGELERSQMAHTIEIAETRLRLQEALQTELRAQTETHQTEMRSQIEKHRAEMKAHQAGMRAQNEAHQTEMKDHQAEMRALSDTHRADTRVQYEAYQTELRAWNEATKEEKRSLTIELDSLQREVSRLRGVNESLQEKVTSKNGIIKSKDREISSNIGKDATLTRKEFELASKNAILERQSSTIRELNEKLTRAREFIAEQKPQSHPTHAQAKITWQPCRDLPVGMFSVQTVVIGDKVYCGGGVATTSDSSPAARFVSKYFSSGSAAAATASAAAAEYRVFCYSPSEDTWNTLPDCDVRHFGLSQVRGKLVTVGGRKRSDGEVTNGVYEFDEVSQSWKQSIPPMPTARRSPTVLSHHSALTVAGGCTGYRSNTDTSVVELFREETSQWHTTEPLPSRWIFSASVLIDNRWYLIGEVTLDDGYVVLRFIQIVCAHVDKLLQKALPRDKASTDRDKPAWEVLPDTPISYRENAVHVYSPYINAWIHISDLPASQEMAATAMLSPTEFLVIGGRNNRGIQNSVYKGLLQIE